MCLSLVKNITIKLSDATNEDIEHENNREEKVGDHENLESPIVGAKIIGDRIVSTSLFVVPLGREGVGFVRYATREEVVTKGTKILLAANRREYNLP